MEEIKTISFRMPKPIWLYFKKLAADRDTSLTDLMVTILKKYKINSEKKLT